MAAPTDTTPPVPAPRRRWRAVAITALLVAALVAAAWYLVQRSRTPAGPMGRAGPGGPPPGAMFGGMGSVTVGMAQAVQGDLPVLIDALGTVTPSASATLVPQVSGVLTEVLFTEGQQVKKGQVLARIDARPFEQALAQARAQTARDAAQLEAARVTLARYQELWRQDSIARQTLDTQSALVAQLDAAVQSDRASERNAQLNVDYTQLRAPIAGTIGLRAVDPGNLVSSGTSGGIATITQVRPIDVVFSVPQDRVPAVRAAQQRGALPVTALDRGRAAVLATGRFLTLDNQVNTATGTVRAKARFDNADGALFPNQFVNARLQLGTEAGVLVPVTAVRTGPQGDYVYVVDAEQVAHLRPVTRGMASVDRILVTQGLQAGERVVTEGGDRVKDGGPVQLAGAPPVAAGAGARTGGQRRGGERGQWRERRGAAGEPASAPAAPGAAAAPAPAPAPGTAPAPAAGH
ncbi:membrane fusion protein, multidrug efflux system [Oryzisolibacter propanilivorax]|uniref:Membrane fusion protein, multidrug efflux system n=1 Tax=Oryzisolibacter propanilivorax TaxID=1527607 RepID=A0A1G9SVS4_9BURK|nr:efflux RND transporter periplasmic adaptor subunit [Oryzisolibacter propanilivorax]SDM39569.1 membrane fusion protein, multidrug efflux system [Oryzisolibacter propanilivorax]